MDEAACIGNEAGWSMRVTASDATGFVGSVIVEELLAHELDIVGLAQSDHGLPPRPRGRLRRSRGRSGQAGCGRRLHLSRPLRRCRPARIKREDVKAPQMGPAGPSLLTDLRSAAYFDAEERTAAYAQATGRRTGSSA